MPEPLVAGMPLGLDLTGGYIVRFNAISPASGANVAGVVVSDVSIEAAGAADTTIGDQGLYELIPGQEG